MTDEEARQLAALRAIHERRLDVFVHWPSGDESTRWIVTDRSYVQGRPGRGMGPTLADAVERFLPAAQLYGGKKQAKRKSRALFDEDEMEDEG
jgi:hypothetical protein